MADTTVILIKVDGEDIYMTRKRHPGGDRVMWKCEFPFTIEFGLLSPLHQISALYGEKIAANDYQTDWIRADAADKKIGAPVPFKYTVAVYAKVETEPDVYKVLVEDPEIIIDP